MVMKQLNLYSSLELQPGKRQRCKPTFIMLLHLCEGVRACIIVQNVMNPNAVDGASNSSHLTKICKT